MPRAELLTRHTARRGSGSSMAANNVPVEDTKRFRGSFETKITGIYYHRPEAAALDRAQQVLDKMNTPPPPLPAPPDSKKPG